MKVASRGRLAVCAAAGLAVVFIIFYCLLVQLSALDTVELEFESYDKTQKAGAIERGLIPKFLPLSATDIHAVANLDGGGVVVKFSFGGDFEEFLATQERLRGVTPKSLKFNASDGNNFSDTRKFIYVRGLALGDHPERGALLVNLEKRRAMYLHPAITGSGSL